MLGSHYARLVGAISFWTLIHTVLSTPDIGIQQDWFMSPHDELRSFSGVITFNANPDGSILVVSLTDGQHLGLVSKAFDELSITRPGQV